MKVMAIFTSVGVILVGLVIGVPVLGSIFDDDGPYQQLNDLATVGDDCIYGPGRSIYIPGQAGFTLTGNVTAVVPIGSDESVEIEGTVSPSATQYVGTNIQIDDADGAALSTAVPSFAYVVSDGTNDRLIGVGPANSQAYDCDPADGTAANVPAKPIVGFEEAACIYGSPTGSAYQGEEIGGSEITDGIYTLIPDGEPLSVANAQVINSAGLLAGSTLTIGGTALPVGTLVWFIRVGGVGDRHLVAITGSGEDSPVGTVCSTSAANTDAVPFAATDPDAPTGNVAVNNVMPGAEGNVGIRSGGTAITDSPYQGIMIAIIALIPLLVVGFFAFRFFGRGG